MKNVTLAIRNYTYTYLAELAQERKAPVEAYILDLVEKHCRQKRNAATSRFFSEQVKKYKE